MILQLFLTFTTVVFTAQSNEPRLTVTLTTLESQIKCIKEAVDVANDITKIIVERNNKQQNINLICKYLHKIYFEMIDFAQKANDEYRKYLFKVLIKDEEVCNFLLSQNAANHLESKHIEYQNKIRAQKDFFVYNFINVAWFSKSEFQMIIVEFGYVEKQLLEFMKHLVDNYKQLRNKILTYVAYK